MRILYISVSVLNTLSIFQLRIDGKEYAAKKLVNIGNGRSNCIPISDAIENLTADLIRLKRMAYFASRFKLLAQDYQVQIAGKLYIVSLLCTTQNLDGRI